MKLLKSDYKTLVDILFSAKKRVLISFANITVHLAEALLKLKENNIDIAVYIEITEDSYRQGYGEIEGLSRLINGGIDLRDRQEINIYFLIADNTGYFYFPKSRFHEAEGLAYDLMPMVEKQVHDIAFLFSGPHQMDDVPLDTPFDDYQVYEIDHLIKRPEKQEVNELIKQIKRNPPPKPDHKRLLDVYQTKFQFVDLKFKGVKFHTRKIKIPADAIPFKDKTLRRSIEANLKMFENLFEKDFMRPYQYLIEEFEDFRKTYLFRIKCLNKSLIKKSEKYAFESKLNEFRELIKQTIDHLSKHLEKEIDYARKKISESLTQSLSETEIDYQSSLPFFDSPASLARRIINRIEFPSSHEIFKEISLTWNYSDITWEDLNKDEVTDELFALGLLEPDERAFNSERAIGADDE